MEREDEKEKRRRRRNDQKRKKAKARRVYSSQRTGNPQFDFDDSEIEVMAAKHANHLAVCSCEDCGNPRRRAWRKKDQLTLQERRALQDDDRSSS